MDVTIHHEMLEGFAELLSSAAADAEYTEASDRLQTAADIITKLIANTRARQNKQAEQRVGMAKHFRRVAQRVQTNMEETSDMLARQLQAGSGLTDSNLTRLLKAQADAKIYGRFFGTSAEDAELADRVADQVRDLRHQVRWGGQSTDSLTRAISDYDRRAMFDFIEQWAELA